jgi:hypothetical protein
MAPGLVRPLTKFDRTVKMPSTYHKHATNVLKPFEVIQDNALELVPCGWLKTSATRLKCGKQISYINNNKNVVNNNVV